MIDTRASGGLDRPWPSAPTVLVVAIAIACWVGAVAFVFLHVVRGPAQQSVVVRWSGDTTELARRAAERTLRLRDGEESEPGQWVYRLQTRSRQSIRQIVSHPLVADTSHIDREAFTVLIDAPAIPALVRRVLEVDLAPALSLLLAIVGTAVLWPVRRELPLCADIVGAIPGLGLASALALLSVGFWAFADNGQGVDENVHYDQIVRLANADWTLHPALTMLPGFHGLVAALAWMTGGAGPLSVRVIVFGLSVATVVVFHALARRLYPEHAGTRTLQFALLPILFPQFFLIYTDVTSLLFVLLMMLAAHQRRPWLAGWLGLLSCLMRQNNIIWVAFAMVWSYVREHGWTWRPLSYTLGRYWTFVATGMAFLLFLILNGGEAALGDDVGSHPLGAVYFGNVFFLFFLACFLFLPLWLGYRGLVGGSVRRWWPWLSLAALVPVFWFGFVNDHPHNNERAGYFLPNALLMYFSSTALRKVMFFGPVAVAWLCVTAAPVRKPWWLLLPFTILFLVPEWLIVPRYYLIPLSLFLLAREPTSPWSERLQTTWFAAVSLSLFVVVERGWGWV